jgi:glycosyltransferase involved in cell wall biosynthesis
VARAAGAVPGTEILLVEQGTPSAAEVCSSLAVTASVVRDDGVGASRARNIGARAARGDIVLFTDDDCEVPERWVRDHEGALADRDVVASFGRVAGLGSYDEEHDPAAMPARHRRGRPPWLVGHASNMAVRREAFLAAGGFDERIGPGTGTVTAGEDADLIVRLLRTGREIATGTGEPVRHIEWRSGEQLHDNLVAYERGAGMWIGKAFRESPTEGFAFLRGRLALIRDLAAYARENGGPAVPVAALSAALARGLAAGVRMRPWRG